jgi:histidyl-tRNA synthetase
MSKPGLPQGTRDFGPEAVYKRRFIFNTIRRVFELYGYEPLETPAMENLETLLGKYGEEGDKLLFKILNNGLDHLSKKDSARVEFEKILTGKNNPLITERALRYDLTIPFARYVATHHHELPFPFKRYQIQPVWRADRPQKGRYREFWQCDADVVGSRSLLNEAELIRIYLRAFAELRLEVELRINHRRILAGLAEACGGQENLIAITTAIDKLDKTGWDKIKQELADKGINGQQIPFIRRYLDIGGTNREKLDQVTALLDHSGYEQAAPVKKGMNNEPPSSADEPDNKSNSKNNTQGREGITDIRHILDFFSDTPNLVLDLSLARGLNYYTGTIFEVRAKNVKLGSIGGGGRYDDLTGLFGVPGIPGVGISFGVDRIYDAMEELKLFPDTALHATQFLFFNLGPEAAAGILEPMEQLRNAGIRCELYPEQAKFEKQFKYAEKKRIPFAVIIGTEELQTRTAKIKNLATGVQESCTLEQLMAYVKGLIVNG